MTASILSFAFWVIGLPYFLLVGVFAGIVEILPVIGPLIAGLIAVAAGLTVSWQLGLAAAIVVYGLRIVQDYVINPRLFGRAVHMPPLAVLLAVSAVALLLGPWWVPLAIPLTAVVSTLLDVLVWKRDPADEAVPTVLAPTDDTVQDRRRRPWLLLMALVGTVLSLAFWAIGLPYWLLVGAFAGVVEIVPVIGPLAAGGLAVGVGLTASVTTAVSAGAAVLIVRLLEDYIVMPRVLGDAVGLSPLLVLVAVTACGVVFGGLAVLLAIPVAAVLVTRLDVLILKKDPAQQDVPSVIFPAADSQEA